MSAWADDEVGPIDYVLVELAPGASTFDRALATELASLVEAEMIRVLDLMILVKAADGATEVVEFEDIDDLGDLAVLEGTLAEIVAAEDVDHLASAMEPGTAAGLLVWENTWAAPFALAARRAGGQLIASGRIPPHALVTALTACLDDEGA